MKIQDDAECTTGRTQSTGEPSPRRANGAPVIQSYNEWDPLEEVIVGNVDGATVPPWDATTAATIPPHAAWFFKKHGHQYFPHEMVQRASEELEGLVALLQGLGITVRRPDRVDFATEYQTPWWKSRGLYAAMPRDAFLVVGDTIFEAAMAWRTRYFEAQAYHPLLHDYFRRGARWIAAPKSRRDDAFFNRAYDPDRPTYSGKRDFPIHNTEIAFDAADFVRMGRDILVQRSHVTNDLGIEWLRRHVGSEYRIHVVEFDDPHPMHIDTTIVPLAPGKILINPSWVKSLPETFRSWDVLVAPPPAKPFDSALYFSSDWLSINVLSIDQKRVIVEAQETPLIEALKQWGFEPIPIPFRNFYPFGGSVHCATLDVRRRGSLETYF